MREAIAPIQNKLGQALLHPALRRLGHDKANLVGSLLATQFQLAAMSRVNQTEEERCDFHLVIDEFQNFTTETFAAMPAEVRKYRLSLTLSHQYIEQISPALRRTVFGNAATMVSFRVGQTDGETLKGQYGRNFVARQFVEMGKFQVLVKFLENGTPREPFLATTLSPLSNQGTRLNV